MGIYDAYQLSVRDSTEFTVNSGNGPGNWFDIVDVDIDFTNSGLDNYFITGVYFYSSDEFGTEPSLEDELGISTFIRTEPKEYLLEDTTHWRLPVVIPPSGGTVLLSNETLYNDLFDVAITGNIQLMGDNISFLVKGPGTITISQKANEGGEPGGK